MADKSQLSDMLDALINDKSEEAQIAFHQYLGSRMREEIHGEVPEVPPETNED